MKYGKRKYKDENMKFGERKYEKETHPVQAFINSRMVSREM